MIGSTRPNRICPDIADWFLRTVRPASALSYDLIDLAVVDLPFLDEPQMASTGIYNHEHTRLWSERVLSYDAFVFVFPQYNWAYPAVLKNAIDFLYAEWAGKPAGIVTYGTHGGGKGAAQWGSVLQGIHMNRAEAAVLLSIPSNAKDEPDWMRDLDGKLAQFVPDVLRLDAELTALLVAP
ncbi:NADPH-dependent FMN reductase [Leifsonia sp. A12D58]|uniref:NADPH-dependent FMN reductase n=1 Tax=Leifsonia sp. A12D58 TaxID=3397674 RepID=UPI0039E017DE